MEHHKPSSSRLMVLSALSNDSFKTVKELSSVTGLTISMIDSVIRRMRHAYPGLLEVEECTRKRSQGYRLAQKK